MYRVIVGVDGMRCPMCEAHVNDAVRKAFKVDKVTASRGKKNCEIICATQLSEESVRRVIEESGYTCLGFSCEPWEKKGLLARLFG